MKWKIAIKLGSRTRGIRKFRNDLINFVDDLAQEILYLQTSPPLNMHSVCSILGVVFFTSSAIASNIPILFSH